MEGVWDPRARAAQRGGQGGAARRGTIPAGVWIPWRRRGTSLTCTGSFSCPPEPERPQREPPNPRPAEPPPPACAMLEVRVASAPPPLEFRSRLREPRLLGVETPGVNGACPLEGPAGQAGDHSQTMCPGGLWPPGKPKVIFVSFCWTKRK